MFQDLNPYFMKNRTESGDDQRKVVLCYLVNSIFAAATAFYVALGFGMGLNSTLLLPSLFLNLFVVYYLFSGRSYLMGARMTLFAILVGFYVLIGKFGGYPAITLFALPLIPVSAAYLTKGREPYFWSLLTSAGVVVVCQTAPMGFWEINIYEPEQRERLLNLVIFLVPMMLCVISARYERGHQIYRDRLAESKKKAERALRDKGNLLAILSHDIANHTMIISAASSVLTRLDEEGTRQAKYHHKIKHAAELTESVIKMVREMEAINRNRKEFKAESVGLANVLQDIEFIFGDRAKEKRIDLKLNSSPDLSVKAEPVSLLNQVLSNLVSNAIKFTPEGKSVCLEASRSKNPGYIDIMVRDEGIGIPKDKLALLFDDGSQVSSSGTSGEAGHGLGLLIVENYIRLYEGSISVSSVYVDDTEDGQSGTSFIISLKEAVSLEGSLDKRASA